MTRFYYIARRKPRNRSLQYAGDGIVDAETKTEAKKIIAYRYKVSLKNIFIRIHNDN